MAHGWFMLLATATGSRVSLALVAVVVVSRGCPPWSDGRYGCNRRRVASESIRPSGSVHAANVIALSWIAAIVVV
jgi:hypothetical protein